MNMLFFASLIVLILLIAYENKKHGKLAEKQKLSFWEKEQLANSTRKKPLDNLAYITIPHEDFPMTLMADNPAVQDCLETLQGLQGVKIVNLTGISNTDLKLQYGTANITCLSEYDQSYTLLVRTLQKWADLLLSAGYEAETRKILEFALTTGTDVSKTYYTLADIYRRQGEEYKVSLLIEKAQSLNSTLRNSIVRTLQESDPCNG